MPVSKPESGDAERQVETPQLEKTEVLQGSVQINVNAKEVEAAQASNPDRSDGSANQKSILERARTPAGGNQDTSIKIVGADQDGKEIVHAARGMHPRASKPTAHHTELSVSAKIIKKTYGEETPHEADEIKPAKGIGTIAVEAIQAVAHPFKDNPDDRMDYPAARKAFDASTLRNYGIDPLIIAATMRNEIQHRKFFIDDAQENEVRVSGDIEALREKNYTIGDMQMQVQNILRLVHSKNEQGMPSFPQLQHMREGALIQSLDPKNGALLVGAYYEETAQRLDIGLDPIPTYHGKDREEIIKIMREDWKSGDNDRRTDALIRSYNPGYHPANGPDHVDTVRGHLKVIRDREK